MSFIALDAFSAARKGSMHASAFGIAVFKAIYTAPTYLCKLLPLNPNYEILQIKQCIFFF
jgi:hypothetical protein